MLRAELEHFVTSIGARRNVPPQLYVGEPGRERLEVSTAAGDGPEEAGWRADVLERAVAGVNSPVCSWLTRSGALEPGDHDVAWCGAALAAFGRHGLELPGFFVVSRHGWVDVLSGEAVHYHRIRRR
jgi:hypothetical protein